MLPLLEEKEQLVPVPGFGFLPSSTASKIDSKYQDLLTQEGDLSNFTTSELDQIKCEYVVVPSWRSLFPSLADLNDKSVCPPVWDGASCLPPTPSGQTAVLPCMTSAFGVSYSPDYNASKRCLDNGQWGGPTNYLACLCEGGGRHVNTSNCVNITGGPDAENDNELSVNIHIVGYSLSFLALVCSLTIYLSFREMRCLRHKIHMGLFCAFGLSALNWILTLSWGDLVPRHYATPLLCATFTLTYFFHLTSFYWMFLEGLYLFLQVQYPLSLVSIKFKHFLLFGWGGPILNILVWVSLRLHDHNKGLGRLEEREEESECLFMEETPVDRWVMQAPMLVILFFNTIFLFWIMSIVIIKLRHRTAMDHDKRHWKAAKALIFVMPLLGFGHILTLVVQPAVASIGVPLAEQISDAVEAVITSAQGLMISLPYCFLNSEVQSVLKNHWKRWRMVRRVGKGAHRSRCTSLNASTTYYAIQKSSTVSAKWDGI